MMPYIAITSFISLIAFLLPGRRGISIFWLLAFFILLIFVGLRHHVGMDWNNYLILIARVADGSLNDVIMGTESGYSLILWVSAKLGLGIYGANFAGTLIFLLGLFRYARTTAAPFLALSVAMPFLVIVIGMSANRQAVAIGVIMWLIADWQRATILKRSMMILLAAQFHTSALFFLIFVMADLRIRTSVKLFISGIFIIAMFAMLQGSGRLDYYDSVYVSGQTEATQSSGAILHVLMNGGPALLMFLPLKSWRKVLFTNTLHRQMALLAITLIPMSLIASTASGRISLYLFPVSMYVLSSIPQLTASILQRQIMRFLISISMLGLAVIWLSLANSSSGHIPYNNLLTTPSELWVLCC